MSAIVALGEPARVAGLGLAGCTVIPVADARDAEEAWERLPADVGLLILGPAAAAALRGRLDERPHMLWTVLP